LQGFVKLILKVQVISFN